MVVKTAWNRCGRCRQKSPFLKRVDGIDKGTYCPVCVDVIERSLKRGFLCRHLRNAVSCRKKECIVRQVLEL